MTNKNKKPKIAITMGDPSGIGAEIIAKALPSIGGKFSCVVIGDRVVFDRAVHTCKLGGRVNSCDIDFIDVPGIDIRRFSFGTICAQYGGASIAYLDKAMELINAGVVDGVVTCPISKESIHLAGYSYSGHTEYFGEKAGVDDEVMMLVNDTFKFCMVTRHIPLSKVAREIDPSYMKHVVAVTYDALRRLFGIRNPRIVVCGINPHGSDNGVIGDDENTLIAPVVKGLRSKFSGLTGPVGADVAIGNAARKKYDAVIAMYHDQALIPLKVTGDESGVNMTLGLGFVRTSPLHGTAFDIAGQNKADPSSLIAAVHLAYQCVLNQKKA
jgi:4-hydroxythreonine-4-phosphate dehydrogenase